MKLPNKPEVDSHGSFGHGSTNQHLRSLIPVFILLSFCHLMHQSIVPFSPESFPYEKISGESLLNAKCLNDSIRNTDFVNFTNNNLEQVINLQNVKLVIEPNISMPECEKVFLWILALSAPQNFDSRNVLRQDVEIFRSKIDKALRGSIRITFLLGLTLNYPLNERIQREAAQYNDILLLGVDDSYYNLSYKTLGGYQWLNSGFPSTNISWIVKTDDDVKVDWPQFTSGLENKQAISESSIFCHVVLKNRMPDRRKGKKLYVSYTEWPHSDAYPPYCNGWVYAIRPKVAEKLTIVAQQTQFNHIDDLFVTGILRERLKIDLIELSNIPLWFSKHLSSCTFFNIIWVEWLEKLAFQREEPLILELGYKVKIDLDSSGTSKAIRTFVIGLEVKNDWIFHVAGLSYLAVLYDYNI